MSQACRTEAGSAAKRSAAAAAGVPRAAPTD